MYTRFPKQAASLEVPEDEVQNRFVEPLWADTHRMMLLVLVWEALGSNGSPQYWTLRKASVWLEQLGHLAEELLLALPGHGDGLVAEAVLDSALSRIDVSAQLLRVRLARCMQVRIRPVVLRSLYPAASHMISHAIAQVIAHVFKHPKTLRLRILSRRGCSTHLDLGFEDFCRADR